MPPSLFASRIFFGVNIVTVFLYGCLAGVIFLLPFDLIVRRGMTAAEVGLTLMPFSIILGLFSRLAGSLADRYGTRPFLVIGSALVCLGSLVFALNIPDYWLGVLLPVVILAAGMATAVSPLTTAVMNAVPEERSGAASGVSNAATRLAALLAVALLGAVASLVFMLAAEMPGANFGTLPPVTDPARQALESAFRTAYAIAMLVGAAWGAAAALTAWLLLREKAPAEPRAG